MLFGLEAKLIAVLAGVLGFLGSLFMAYKKGRSSKQNEVEKKQLAEIKKVVEKARENQANVINMSDSELRNELRKYARDSE